MTRDTHYRLPDLKNWQGRADAPDQSCFFQIIQPLNLRENISPKNQLAFAFIGFSCDEGIRRNLGRVGAADGPLAIRQALAKFPVQKQNILCFDAGDITCSDGDLENAQKALGDAVAILLQHHLIPIVLGGGHELAFGHYQGIAKQFPNEKLGIINFDAHFDMRPLSTDAKGSSGTPFLQIAKAHALAKQRLDYNCIGIQHTGNIRQLFETAKEHHAHFILADDIHQGDNTKSFHLIDQIISQNEILYLSLCLDVFAVAFAPGVSAPQTLGLMPWQVIPLVRQLAASGKMISYDIAELSPPHDTDQRTAKLAASFIYEIIHHHCVKKGLS